MLNAELEAFAKAVSRVLGWAYFLSWSASFYPQLVQNYHRQSTLGLAIDFPTLNVLGFACYALSTAAFLYAPTIRAQYAQRHPDAPDTTVRFNDFLFAAHGAVLCVVYYPQFFPGLWGFRVGRSQRASRAVVLMVVGGRAEGGLEGEDGGASGWAWIDVVYTLGYIKLLTVVLKYIPQAWVNYKRQSTRGWSIYPLLLDFAGGWLSLAQLLLDAALTRDWSGVTGNPVKFGLGNITIVFDVVFMLQHYVLYRRPGDGHGGGGGGGGGGGAVPDEEDRRPLLNEASMPDV